MISRSRVLLIATAIGIFAPPALADSVLDRLPPFEARLEQAPLVVVARMVESVRTSIKAFRDAEEPFVEVYTHYLLKVDRVLKGDFEGDVLEVRVLGGSKNNFRTELRTEPPEEVPAVYLLSPDFGIDPATGMPRETFVIIHDTVMPIRNKTAMLVTDDERRAIGLSALVDQIARTERERANEAQRGEPAYAQVPVDPGTEAHEPLALPDAEAIERVEVPMTGADERSARPSDRKQPGTLRR